MQYNLFTSYNYKFFSLGSGSNGNCYYLGADSYGILIDAGIGFRTIRKRLLEYGVSFDRIMGVLVTHNHVDHAKTAGCLGDKHNIPVYATQAVLDGIRCSRHIQGDLYQSGRVIDKEVEFRIKDFEITAFDVPHDSIENVGYRIRLGGQVFILLTDVGHITDTIVRYAACANHLVVESNYDEEMLRQGRYPYHLKQRITSGMGHISNRVSADFIANIYHAGLKNIWLCHLSQDNNHPDLAYGEVAGALRKKGIIANEHVRLDVLSRYKVSGLREF